MKRTIVFFGLMVCFALGLSAQSIVGKWRAQNKVENDAKFDFDLTFNPDNTLLIGIFVNMSNPDEMEMDFHLNMDGTYGERNGNVIPFKFNADKAEITIDRLEFKGEMAEQVKNNKELETGIRKLMQDQINSSKGDMTKDIPSEGEMTIIEQTATTMKIQMGDKEDEILDFVKVD